jgi:hypothetical protein
MVEAQISLIGQQDGKYAPETYGPRCIDVFRKFYVLSFILVFEMIKRWKMLFFHWFLGNKTSTPLNFRQSCHCKRAERFPTDNLF